MKRLSSLVLFLFGFASCVLFFFFKVRGYGTVPLIVSKIVPCAAMCVWLAGNLANNKHSVLVLAGVFCSLLCDLFMELPNGSFQLFGILSNMAGLFLYILYFAKSCRTPDPFSAVPIFVIVMSVFSVIAPTLGGLLVPVLVYCAFFIVFMWRALVRSRDPGIAESSKRTCVLGSVCVICSDSLLSFQMFSILRTSFFYVVLIMMLWWVGLLLLTVTAGLRERVA